MPLTSQAQVLLSATQTAAATAPDLGTLNQGTHVLNFAKIVDLINGTGAGAADVLWSDTGTLAASANTDIDLAGALTNAIGGTSVFARVKAIVIAAAAGNTNNVVVGAAATNAWATMLNSTGTVQLRPGGFMLASCSAADATGWAVTAGTGDLLRLANSGAGTSVTYDIAIVGCSA